MWIAAVSAAGALAGAFLWGWRLRSRLAACERALQDALVATAARGAELDKAHVHLRALEVDRDRARREAGLVLADHRELAEAVRRGEVCDPARVGERLDRLLGEMSTASAAPDRTGDGAVRRP